MNKKFFAALASATMAFTASGSIAVFADDFVEEKTPVLDGNDVKPVEKEVLWSAENFGALVKESGTVFTGTDLTELKAADGKTTLSAGVKVKTADLAKVETITLTDKTDDEIKGLEYFTGLTTFSDGAAKETNKALDFSANTKLENLTLTKANALAKLVLPEAFVDEEEDEVYSLKTLDLQNTKLTGLNLSKYDKLGSVTVKGNKNVKEIVVAKGTKGTPKSYATFDLSGNALEEINLENCEFPNGLTLSNNRLGVIDLSKTTIPANKTLTATGQVLYVSEDLATINVKDTFDNIDTRDFAGTGYNDRTGVLDLGKNNGTGYTYTAYDKDDNKRTMTVKVTPANPMNRLYNPNSGEHFYTADIKEKEALVAIGWQDEGYGWVAPTETAGKKAKSDVYRLYNPNAGDHHYTMEASERDVLVAFGWKDEGTGWYSATGDVVEVYRQYNPYANGAGSHNYTTDKAENDYLVSVGWIYEGEAWKALR